MDQSPADHVPELGTVRYRMKWRGRVTTVRVKTRLNFIEAQRQILGMRKKTKAIVGLTTALLLSLLIYLAIATLVIARF